VEDFDLRVERAVLENIHYQVDIALKRYRDRFETGKLTVVGALYDFANIYGKGFGKVFVVNVNGMRSAKEILQRVDEREKPQWGKFLREHFLEL
jgi:carbonic anhydrase